MFLVKDMKLSKLHIERLVRKIFDELKAKKLMTCKVPEEKAFRRAVEAIENEFVIEANLDREVHKMLDDLERQNPNQFQRGKMFGMLKTRLAKEKGIIL